jgi:hypothetical protein
MLLITLCVTAVLSVSSIALQYLTPSLFRGAFHRAETDLTEQSAQRTLDLVQQESGRELARRPRYAYSVVAAGVHDVHELRYAVEHDPVVASHYVGFDYAHARLVRLLMERSVYVSYRIGNRVYWTRHRVKLHKGETLLTDGKMTARTRCGNRVEEKPQEETSRMEPPAAVFDEPLMPRILPSTETPPVPFETTLNRAPAAPLLPLGIYDPIAGGGWMPLSPAPLPNVCAPIKKPTTKGSALETVSVFNATGKGKKKNVDPCTGGGLSEVPEPGTWFMVASGMAVVYWKARQRLARG